MSRIQVLLRYDANDGECFGPVKEVRVSRDGRVLTVYTPQDTPDLLHRAAGFVDALKLLEPGSHVATVSRADVMDPAVV